MKIDFSNFKTINGADIVFHFESESIPLHIERLFTREQFEEQMRTDIAAADNGVFDTGPGTKVHILFNTDASGSLLSPEEFAEWEKDPENERDWKHEPDPIAEFVSMISKQQFAGGTKEMLNKYSKDPVSDALIKGIMKSANCVLCPMPADICFLRNSSFDEIALEKAISEKKSAHLN